MVESVTSGIRAVFPTTMSTTPALFYDGYPLATSPVYSTYPYPFCNWYELQHHQPRPPSPPENCPPPLPPLPYQYHSPTQFQATPPTNLGFRNPSFSSQWVSGPHHYHMSPPMSSYTRSSSPTHQQYQPPTPSPPTMAAPCTYPLHQSALPYDVYSNQGSQTPSYEDHSSHPYSATTPNSYDYPYCYPQYIYPSHPLTSDDEDYQTLTGDGEDNTVQVELKESVETLMWSVSQTEEYSVGSAANPEDEESVVEKFCHFADVVVPAANYEDFTADYASTPIYSNESDSSTNPTTVGIDVLFSEIDVVDLDDGDTYGELVFEVGDDNSVEVERGQLETADHLFDEIPLRSKVTDSSVFGYSNMGQVNECVYMVLVAPTRSDPEDDTKIDDASEVVELLGDQQFGGQCGSLENTLKVFDETPVKEKVHDISGHLSTVAARFEGTNTTFSHHSVILADGNIIDSCVEKLVNTKDEVPDDILVVFCESLRYAHLLFDENPERDKVTWAPTNQCVGITKADELLNEMGFSGDARNKFKRIGIGDCDASSRNVSPPGAVEMELAAAQLFQDLCIVGQFKLPWEIMVLMLQNSANLAFFRDEMTGLLAQLEGPSSENYGTVGVHVCRSEEMSVWSNFMHFLSRECHKLNLGWSMSAARQQVIELINSQEVLLLLGDIVSGMSSQLLHYIDDLEIIVGSFFVCSQNHRNVMASMATKVTNQTSGCYGASTVTCYHPTFVQQSTSQVNALEEGDLEVNFLLAMEDANEHGFLDSGSFAALVIHLPLLFIFNLETSEDESQFKEHEVCAVTNTNDGRIVRGDMPSNLANVRLIAHIRNLVLLFGMTYSHFETSVLVAKLEDKLVSKGTVL